MLDSLRRLCSKRECCSSELRRRIAAEPELDAEAILASLREDGYLSDGRYARAFARDKAALDGWGAIKIRYALKSKGIDDETIDAALDEVDTEASGNRLRKLLEARNRALRDDPQRRLKLIRYALGRGYSYDEVSPVLRELVAGDEGSDG